MYSRRRQCNARRSMRLTHPNAVIGDRAPQVQGLKQGDEILHIRNRGSFQQRTECEDAWNSVEWYFLGSCSQTPASAATGTMCALTALASLAVAWLSPRGATTARTGTSRGCRPGSIRPSRMWNSVLASSP